MNDRDFTHALCATADLLATLPRSRDARSQAMAAAHSAFAAFPALQPRLLVDQTPGSPLLDYDVLLQRPAGGSVALSWRPDATMPWALVHSDHWAANFVLTVDDQDVPVQDALFYLRTHAERYPDLMQDMLDGQLVIATLQADPPPVSDGELQRESDLFRRAHGLLTAQATHHWLRDSAVGEGGFRDFLIFRIRERKFFDALAEASRTTDLLAHAAELERVDLLWVHGTPDEVAAMHLRTTSAAEPLARIAADALLAGDLAPGFERVRLFARQLPPELEGAAEGSAIGPLSWRGQWGIAQVIRRAPATADAGTLAQLRAMRRRAWLDARRAEVVVYWHWF